MGDGKIDEGSRQIQWELDQMNQSQHEFTKPRMAKHEEWRIEIFWSVNCYQGNQNVAFWAEVYIVRGARKAFNKNFRDTYNFKKTISTK